MGTYIPLGLRELLETSKVELMFEEYVGLIREGFEEYIAEAFCCPNTTRDETFVFPSFMSFSHSLSPAFRTKLMELGSYTIQYYRPGGRIPRINHLEPTVAPPVYSVIQASYKTLFDSIKSASAYVKSLAGCCIKNEQSLIALEDRLARVEEQVAVNMQVAKNSLETARESKIIQENVYTLLKKKVEQVSDHASETKLARLKKAVEVPGQIIAIVFAIGGYLTYIEKMNEIMERIFGKLPDEAEKIIPELEEIISDVERFEIRESSYALIGSVCTDLLNNLSPSGDVFSVTASDITSSITSKIKHGEITNSNEVILASSMNNLALTLLTDMSSKTSISFAGDIYQGVKETLTFSLPDKNTKMMLRFQHPRGGCCAFVETQPAIAFGLSGVLGFKEFSAGGDVRFDATSKVFSKYDLAGGYDTALYSCSVTIAEKCDVIRASIARKIFPGTIFGAEGT